MQLSAGRERKAPCESETPTPAVLTHWWEGGAGSGTAFGIHPPHVEVSVCRCWIESCATLQARVYVLGRVVRDSLCTLGRVVRDSPDTATSASFGWPNIVTTHLAGGERGGRGGAGAPTPLTCPSARELFEILLFSKPIRLLRTIPVLDVIQGLYRGGCQSMAACKLIHGERGEGSGGSLGLGPYG